MDFKRDDRSCLLRVNLEKLGYKLPECWEQYSYKEMIAWIRKHHPDDFAKIFPAETLVRWVNLSRFITQGASSITSNKCPSRYAPYIERLMFLIKTWQEDVDADLNRQRKNREEYSGKRRRSKR